MIIPLALTLYGQLSESGVDDNGDIISGMDFIKEKIRVNKMLAGEVTEEWLQDKKDLYHKLYPEYVDSILDQEKMKSVYGESWKENDELYRQVYEYPFERTEHKYDVFYQFEGRKSKNMFTLQYLLDAISYGEFILNKDWESYDKTEHLWNDSKEITPEIAKENELTKVGFRNTKHFYYGETTIFKSIFSSLKNTGVVLGYFILILFSSMFNKEEKNETNALLKTTKNGKRKLIYAKICTTIIVSVMIPLLLVLLHFLGYTVLFGLPDFMASFQILIQTYLEKISHLTVGSILLQIIGLLVVGCVTIAILSMVISSFVKSSYHSLIISFLILVIPLFIMDFKIGTFGLKTLIPLEYMNYSEHLFVNTSTIKKSFYDITLIFKSILLPILLLPIPYFLEKRKEIGNR